MRALEVAAVAVAIVAGCTQIAGLDGLDYAATGGAGMDGGAAGVATDGGGGSAGGGNGGAPPCGIHDAGSCGRGKKCSVVDNESGATGCVAVGPRSAWQRCNVDSDCGEGLWCDVPTSVCHPICEGVGDCAGLQAQCIQARASAMPIPALTVCTADCHPLTTAPCDDAGGPTTCYYRIGDSLWDCVETQGSVAGASCTDESDCGDGLVCIQAGTCEPWCTPPDASAGDCSGLMLCFPTDPAVTHDGVGYGICG